MFTFPVRFAFATVLLTCSGTTAVGAMDIGRTTANTTTANSNSNSDANAQAAPVQYWIPGWPAGFSGSADGTGVESYGNFPSFVADGDSGFFSRRYSTTTTNWSAFAGGLGLQGISPYAASFGGLTAEGSQFGYKFKSGVSLYGGFDTLRADRGSNAFAAFDSNSSTLPIYSAHGGVEFKPTANTTLSFGFSYTGQGSDRLDSDIRSPALPGETPAAFTSGRR